MSAPPTFESILAPLVATQFGWDVHDKTKAAVAAARALPPPEQVCLALLTAQKGADNEGFEMLLQPLLSSLLRKKLPFDPGQATALVETITRWRYGGPLLPVLNVAGSVPMTAELRAALSRLRGHDWFQSGYSDAAKALARLEEILGTAPPEPPAKAGPWTRHVLDSVVGTPGEPHLRQILASGLEITGSKPTKKWLLAANRLVDCFGREDFRRRAAEWLDLGPSTLKPPRPVEGMEYAEQQALVWSLSGFSDRETCAALAAYTERCLEKIPMIGPVFQKGGNAGVNVLAAMGGDHALGQLARLGTRIRYATAQRLIAKALEEAAASAGLSRDELEERTVPGCGLDAHGRRVRRIGGYSVECDVHDPALRFLNGEGKPVASLPAALQTEHADELKRARAASKELSAMLTAHRLRIERLLMTSRQIPLGVWRQHYLDHPLLQDLTRRLIWRMISTDRDQTAIWANGRFEEWNGSPVEPSEDAAVRLWHPIHSDVQTVLAWRCFLEDSGVRQPFKQAHREIYVLTDAERQTHDHSNRFAGHILAQHQFAALAKARGWRFTLMGMWDSHNTPTLELPHAGLEAQLHVDFALEDGVSGHAVYLYIATDRVTFHRLDERTPIPLETVPRETFSEVMRDIDLFVGVTSVASDPAWTPGQWRQIDDYRERTQFGDLGVAAAGRRDLLSRLLPHLPIADRATLEDRFLVVRGERGTYKIHLGSANVLMEPGSRYLCIVHGAGSGHRVMLPFEGDYTLSLILSKALLLANDRKIKDASILNQME